jgi:hypothetical protein
MCNRGRGDVGTSAKPSLSAIPSHQVSIGCLAYGIGGWSEGYADLRVSM